MGDKYHIKHKNKNPKLTKEQIKQRRLKRKLKENELNGKN